LSAKKISTGQQEIHIGGRIAIVTLWGKLAEDFDAQHLYEHIGDQHFIVEWDGHDVSTLEPSDTTLYTLGNKIQKTLLGKDSS
jgi:hypothetical protein